MKLHNRSKHWQCPIFEYEVGHTIIHMEPDHYDILGDVMHVRKMKWINFNTTPPFIEKAHPFFLKTEEYYKLWWQLNEKQQALVNDVLMTKKLEPHKSLYLFLTGGAGTSKIFTTKVLYEGMIWFYDKQLDSDPLKPKVVVVASTGKATFNAGGTTAHSIFHLPYSSSKMLPLDSDTLDNLRKHLNQLQFILINETSLIGSTMPYNIDRRLWQIRLTPTKPFGNIDIIFCGDFY